MKKPHILLFNGPPGAGKDTAARIILDNKSVQKNWRRHLDRMSMPLKKSITAWLDVPVDFLGNSALEARKELGLEQLNGKSYRQAQIHLSEYMTNAYGEQVFGRLLAARISKYLTGEQKPVLICVPDSGFLRELRPLLDVVAADCITVVELHAEGKTFKGDSRSYLDVAMLKALGMRHVPVWNPYNHAGYEANLIEALPYIFKEQ